MIRAAAAANRDGAALHFFVSDDKHVGNLVLLRFTNLEADLFIAQIRFDSEAMAFEFGYDSGRKFLLLVGDREYHCLHRG